MFENIYFIVTSISFIFTALLILVGYIAYERGNAHGYSNGIRDARINKRAELREKERLAKIHAAEQAHPYPETVTVVSRN